MPGAPEVSSEERFYYLGTERKQKGKEPDTRSAEPVLSESN